MAQKRKNGRAPTMTPKHEHDPIPMRYCAAPEDMRRVGDFCWQFREKFGRVLVVNIPRMDPAGFQDWIVSVWHIDTPSSSGDRWQWDANELSPTLTPSLHAIGIWHGFVRDGQLVEA